MATATIRRRGRRWRVVRAYVRATAPAICGLCGEVIDLALPSTDPMSWEADHITPLSLGGAELDPANVRPAHKICNRQRSNKPVPAKASREW